MFTKWSRVISQFGRVGNSELGRHLCSFRCRDYSKVAAVAEPALEKVYNVNPQVNLNKMFWSKPHSLALAPDSPFRVEDPQYEGFKRFMFKLMLFYSKQSKSIRGANVIYQRVIHQVDRPAMYDVFSLEKTFKTTFSLLVIHMWLCLRRLKQEGKEGVELGQYLYEIYNHDVELRVSKAGVNLLLIKWMKDLEKIFYGNLVAYDAAMLPEAKQDELQNVIWRRSPRCQWRMSRRGIVASCHRGAATSKGRQGDKARRQNVFSDDGTSTPSDAALLPVQASYVKVCSQRIQLSVIDSGKLAYRSVPVPGFESALQRSWGEAA
ncbi:putative F-box family protein [Capsicum annuum]|nr:putative F-box family protein [Capsicum annuum]